MDEIKFLGHYLTPKKSLLWGGGGAVGTFLEYKKFGMGLAALNISLIGQVDESIKCEPPNFKMCSVH